jgi:heptosyltransferase III
MRDDDILDLVRRQEELASSRYHQGVIIQPGALGDCILTLPLARAMKETLGLRAVDLIGRSEYISIFPGRTCIGKIRTMEAIEFHRLFVSSASFELEQQDRLIEAFAPYEWITTFLGGDETDFERNLIFAGNCSSGTEVTSVELKPATKLSCHIAEHYIRQFVEKNKEHVNPVPFDATEKLVFATRADSSTGQAILADLKLRHGRTVAIQPGSGSSHKNWPLDNFIRTALILRESDMDVAFLLGPAEVERYDAPILNRLSAAGICASGLILSEVMGLLSQMSAFLGNDSGITHLAGAMGVPSLAVFGPTASASYRPIGPKVSVVDIPVDEFALHSEELCRKVASQILVLADR